MEPLIDKDMIKAMHGKYAGIRLTDVEMCTFACDTFRRPGLDSHGEAYFHNDIKLGNAGLTAKLFGAVMLDVGNLRESTKQAVTASSAPSPGSHRDA